MFQSYALFPHMSVGENVGYGLKVRGVPREDDARRRSLKALETGAARTEWTIGASASSPAARSQRVALARALVTRPAILLLDEPLGALDEKLRLDMQTELVEIQRSLGMTFVYITHSQEEALTMSDRVVLMRRGRIEQSGAPVDLFDRPVSRFAAEFMGFENLLSGTVAASARARRCRLVVAIGDVWSTVCGVRTRGGLPERGRRAASPCAPSGWLAGPTGAMQAQRPQRRCRASRRSSSTAANISTRPSRHADRARSSSGTGIARHRADDFDAVAWRAEDCVVLATA